MIKYKSSLALNGTRVDGIVRSLQVLANTSTTAHLRQGFRSGHEGTEQEHRTLENFQATIVELLSTFYNFWMHVGKKF